MAEQTNLPESAFKAGWYAVPQMMAPARCFPYMQIYCLARKDPIECPKIKYGRPGYFSAYILWSACISAMSILFPFFSAKYPKLPLSATLLPWPR